MFKKPDSEILCPNCDSRVYLTSIIKENHQVNFCCLNENCDTYGFCVRGKAYSNNMKNEYTYNLIYNPK